MDCKHCGTRNEDGAKFCGNCGKSVANEIVSTSSASDVQVSIKPSYTASQLSRKSTAGLAVFLLLGLMSSRTSSSGVDIPDGLLGTIFNICYIIGFIFSIGILLEWLKNRKTEKEWFSWRWIISILIIAGLGLSTLIVAVSLRTASEKGLQSNIHEIVLKIKSESNLPKDSDSVSIWTDVLEEPGAIRYVYMLHDVDISQINNDILKGLLVPKICAAGVKDLFDMGIKTEYSWTVKDSSQTYFVTIDKSDCP